MKLLAILLSSIISLGVCAQTSPVKTPFERYADSARFFESMAHNATSLEQASLYDRRMKYYRLKASEVQAQADAAWRRKAAKKNIKPKKS
jgi:hypothetical protein